MTSILGDIIVIAVLAIIVIFAVKYLIKKHKSFGGVCTGNCSTCRSSCKK